MEDHGVDPKRRRSVARDTRPARSASWSSIWTDTDWETATLLIHPDNIASLMVAERNGFERAEDVEQRTFWRRKVREAS